MMKFEILNTKKHDRNLFDYGIEALNIYLQQYANQDQKRNLSRIFLLADESVIIGYYSICAHSVNRGYLPDDMKLGSYDEVPFLLLGRLAVDKKYQGQGFGDALIVHAFKITKEAAQKVGILGMLVEAKDDNAISFYESFGFKRLKASRNRLVLPITAFSKLI